METVIKTFGVQPSLLAAQVVNFLVLLFLLKKFAYRPILKMLDARREKIALSLKQAEQIENRLQAIEAEKDQRLKAAAKEAQAIISEATKSGAQLIEEARQKASEDIKVLLKKNEEAMAREHDLLQKQIKAELSEMIVIGLTKVAKKVLTEKDKNMLVSETIRSI